VARAWVLAALAVCVACAAFVGRAAATTPTPTPDAAIPGKITGGFLGYCSERPEAKQPACYIRGLLREVDRLGDPATGLPRIDARVHATGGFLEASCHSFMHSVGRTWARQHHITLASLMNYIPRTNDPGCSAGFGMGMTMFLGPTILANPPSALAICSRLPTRYREYTCIHGVGHALMRGYHGALQYSVKACRTLGPTNAPDCAQGAFHDYWISLSGADDTTRPEHAITSARVLCGEFEFKRPCWYRFFWERRAGKRVYTTADILQLCADLDGLQRAGCVGAASLSMSRSREPVDQATTCGDLTGSDSIECLRGVVVPSVANNPFEELSLIRTCAAFPKTTRSRCFNWFGRTLTVVTDGAFRRTGCTQLGDAHARVWCIAGAKHSNQPLRTFS